MMEAQTMTPVEAAFDFAVRALNLKGNALGKETPLEWVHRMIDERRGFAKFLTDGELDDLSVRLEFHLAQAA